MSSNSYVQVPPDGAGKRVYSQEHTIDGVPVQIQGNHIVDKLTPTNAASIDSHGALYTRYAEGSPLLAPYGDMKVLQEHIIGVYEHTVGSSHLLPYG